MSSTGYMPAGLEQFRVWCQNLVNVVTPVPGDWGLTAGEVTALSNPLAVFTADLLISTAPVTRTPVTVAQTQFTFDATREQAAILVEKIQASTLLTEMMAAEAGITFRKTTKTPVPPPSETPSLDIERSTSLNITLRSKVLGAENNALPAGSVGYQVWCLLDPTAPPSTPDNFELIGNGTRRFFTQTFPGTAVGKQCYYAIRYVNARQEWGPWSNIVGSTVVST